MEKLANDNGTRKGGTTDRIDFGQLFAELPQSGRVRDPVRESTFVDSALQLPKLIIDGLIKSDFLPNYPNRVKLLVSSMRSDQLHPYTRTDSHGLVSLAGVKLTVDNDGSGGNKQKDPSYKADTTWHFQGRALDADKIAYLAVPGDLARWGKNSNGKVELGTLVIVESHGKMVACVAGDVGNKTTTIQGRGIGELSVHAAEQLAVNSSPKTGGTENHDTNVIFTNEKVVGITDKDLQKQARIWLHRRQAESAPRLVR